MYRATGWMYGVGMIVSLMLAGTAGAQGPMGGEDLTADMNIPGVVAKVNGVELKSDYIRFR